MSTPSFDLFEKGGYWFARTKLPSGTIVDVALETKHKEAAKDIAKVRVFQKWRASTAGIAAGKHLRARKAAVAEGLKAAAPAPEPDPPPPAPEPAPPPPAPEPAAAAAAPISGERAAEIAGKLRALGDGQPLDDGEDGTPDKVYAPGEREKEKQSEEQSDEVDDETGELLADLIATAIVAGTVKGVAVRLAKRKPPERPGEPHEKMLEWYHFGARENLRKLIGKAGTLGPTAKLFIGGTGVVVSMVWGSEIIDEASQPRQAAPPRPSPPAARAPDAAAPAPSSPANGVARPSAAGDNPAPVPEAGTLALGKFH